MQSPETSGHTTNPLKRNFETMTNDTSNSQQSTPLNVTPYASIKYSFYQQSKVDHADLKAMLNSSREKFKEQLLEVQRSYKGTDGNHDKLQKMLSNDHTKIISCINELGLLCAYEAVKICIAKAQKYIEECDLFKDSSLKCLYFLEESLSAIDNFFPNGHVSMFDAGCDFEKMVAAGYISPKVHALFQVFLSFGGASKLSSIILVKKIITAKVLRMILKRIADLSHLKVSILTGRAKSVDAISAKLQKSLESLRLGKVNLLFATDVFEEAISVPISSTVIRFDIPKTVHGGNVQSWGRGCQSVPQLIIMLERGDAKHITYVSDTIRSESFMNESAKNRDLETCAAPESYSYCVERTGASVTAYSSISLIHRYCARLPANSYEIYPPKPNFQVLPVEDSYQCVMTLPPGADFEKLMGPVCKSSELSKQLVCLEACKKLHQMGALNDHLLLPFSKSVPDGPGSRKRRELHGTAQIRALSGTWGDKLDNGVDFHAYKISFICSDVDKTYSSFVLLLESKLDADVGNLEMKLYLGSKFLNCKVSSCFKLHFDAEQVAKAKCFHELFFNGILAKYVSDQKLWTSSYMYFLLPLELDPCRISWKEIDSCVSVIEFVKKSSDVLSAATHSVGTCSESTNMIHFANRSVHKDHVTDAVVLDICSGLIYIVNEVLQGQDLLRLQRSHSAPSLVDHNLEGKYYPLLPPKRLVITNVRSEVVESIYLLPSLMHRLESLMLASQLREEIKADMNIRSSLILEAITTTRCKESFSSDKLEFLGDMVIDYAVSCHLYLLHPKTPIGPLAQATQMEVRNSTLYNMGIGRGLQNYIRETAFDPRHWTAPGQLPLHPCPCDHGIETREVPIDANYHCEPGTGKSCDRGHRWLRSKTIANCVEALVGAYFVSGGLTGAMHCMKWLGISCEYDPSDVNDAIQIASLHAYTPKPDVLQGLESKLGYEFVVKGLLSKTITHPSVRNKHIYERLNFLGNSALQLLFVWYLYNTYNDMYPGELNDLRAAFFCVENIAQVAVRRNLYPYYQGSLEKELSHYVNSAAFSSRHTRGGIPRQLHDMFNTIAGAILLDTKFNLDEVWRIYEHLLTPIVIPDTLEVLPNVRNLIKWCHSNGYLIKETYRSKGPTIIAKLSLQAGDDLLVGEGMGLGTNRASATVRAVDSLKRFFRGRRGKLRNRGATTHSGLTDLDSQTPADTISTNDCLIEEDSSSITEIPAVIKSSTEKGEPTVALNELCKKMQ